MGCLIVAAIVYGCEKGTGEEGKKLNMKAWGVIVHVWFLVLLKVFFERTSLNSNERESRQIILTPHHAPLRAINYQS